jgi:hypothetical protein
MHTMRISTKVALIALLGSAASMWSRQAASASTTRPVGTWKGESTCLVRPSGCNDEDSVYRFSKALQENQVTLSANKVVNGKEINMGTGLCEYGAAKSVVDCPLPNGSTIHFDVAGDTMQGTMKLKDGKPWRKMRLKRTSSGR